ncbi:hypothetical protein BH23BAC1_BH23BAC1_02990 [soil metagenome]
MSFQLFKNLKFIYIHYYREMMGKGNTRFCGDKGVTKGKK